MTMLDEESAVGHNTTLLDTILYDKADFVNWFFCYDEDVSVLVFLFFSQISIGCPDKLEFAKLPQLVFELRQRFYFRSSPLTML